MTRSPRLAAGLIAAALLLSAVSSISAHEPETPKKVADADAHRPTPLPDRIVLTWVGDPARSQAVTWRTNTSVERGLAQIAVAEPGPHFAGKATEVEAVTELLVTNLGEAHYHAVRFENLEPETKYAYRVGDGVNFSEWFHFTTASDQPKPFSFIYFGDAQNEVKSHWSRVIREAYGDAPQARFMLHAGDLINRADNDAEWGEWFSAGGWLNAMLPSIPTPGNHEQAFDVSLLRRRLSLHWRPQFTLPQNGPPGLEETVYWLDYQGVRIVSLNSNEQLETQATWLDEVLADNPNAWTILTFHHPIYSAARERDNPRLRALWQPVFDRHRVDLVLQGHDHTYARSDLRTAVPAVTEQDAKEPAAEPGTENVPTGLNVRSREAGTVYVVSVSGPKMYAITQPRPDYFSRVAEDTQLYQIISIDGPTLRYEARTATGELYDAFVLKKRPGEANELVEQVPDQPERLRASPAGNEAPRPAEPAASGANR